MDQGTLANQNFNEII